MKSMLFHPTLIPAVLDGRKQRTRRLAGPANLQLSELRSTAFDAGERVYVREPWRPRPADGADGLGMLIDYRIAPATRQVVDPQALADWRWPAAARKGDGWCSPLIMPAFAARADLFINLVRVERLQDITEEEAQLEGLPFQVEPAMVEWNQATSDTDPPGLWMGPTRRRRLTRGPRLTEEVIHHHTAREAFADWWDGLAEEADRRRPRDQATDEPVGAPAPRWADNPWVFVYGFTLELRTP